MLFILHARKKKYDFNLFTELPDAEKFDDVVFQYKEKGSSKWIWRFLQVKSTESIIKMRDLMSESKHPSQNRFSLLKYFISFYKMKNNSHFNNDTLKDFTIITNTDIDLTEIPHRTRTTDDIRKWQSFFDVINEENENINDKFSNDDILYFQNEMFEAKRMKLNECARNGLKNFFMPQFLETFEFESKAMKYVKDIKNSLWTKKKP